MLQSPAKCCYVVESDLLCTDFTHNSNWEGGHILPAAITESFDIYFEQVSNVTYQKWQKSKISYILIFWFLLACSILKHILLANTLQTSFIWWFQNNKDYWIDSFHWINSDFWEAFERSMNAKLCFGFGLDPILWGLYTDQKQITCNSSAYIFSVNVS